MDLFIGLMLVFVSGAMAGSALTPIKFMRRYQFENYWVVHSLTGTVLIPWALAFATIPNLLDVYRQLPVTSLLLPPLFAFSWGIASTLGGCRRWMVSRKRIDSGTLAAVLTVVGPNARRPPSSARSPVGPPVQCPDGGLARARSSSS